MNFKQYFKKKKNIIILFLVLIISFFFYISYFKINNLDFNSIFFKKWIFLFWESIIIYFYVFFLLWLLSILLLLKNKKRKIFILALVLYLVLFLSNIVEHSIITIKWLSDFTFTSNSSRTFYWYDRDYIVFTDKIRSYLWLDSLNKNSRCDLYVFSDNNTLENYWKLVYLKPCKVINEIEKSDYIIYYKKDLPESLINKVVLSYNNNYLVRMK